VTTPETLTATLRIAAPPTADLPYLIDPELMIQWIGHWADLHPEPGGLFPLDVDKAPVRGRFLAVEPPTRVVFTPPTRRATRTQVRLDHLPRSPHPHSRFRRQATTFMR